MSLPSPLFGLQSHSPASAQLVEKGWLRRFRMCRCTFQTHLLLPLIRLWRKRRATFSSLVCSRRSLCSSRIVPVTTSFDVSQFRAGPI